MFLTCSAPVQIWLNIAPRTPASIFKLFWQH
jgi:hypothetical protein